MFLDTSRSDKEDNEAARARVIETHMTLLVNLSACGLIDRRAVATFERQIARDERRRQRAELARRDEKRATLPVYTQEPLLDEKLMVKD
ncbi:MAG: hypothetical protein CYPHOPRED_000758 [Cyphobasidiales sp. Tagirdzhanova-0007]|nr:MAG: hypothetical protein CYPHOPRED_000758 [Cyphobasidiales sp. Tagirdzhanova-0007]